MKSLRNFGFRFLSEFVRGRIGGRRFRLIAALSARRRTPATARRRRVRPQTPCVTCRTRSANFAVWWKRCAPKMPSPAPRCINCATTWNPRAPCWSTPATPSECQLNHESPQPLRRSNRIGNDQRSAPSARRTRAEAGRFHFSDRLENRRTIPDQSRDRVQVPRASARHRPDERVPQRRAAPTIWTFPAIPNR